MNDAQRKKAQKFLETNVGPNNIYSTSMVDLGSDTYQLRHPLTITIEDFGTEVIASWPEVEAWGSGLTDADAINSLKNEIQALYADLRNTAEDQLGFLPARWKRALDAVISPKG